MEKTEKLVGHVTFRSRVNKDETGWPDTLEAFFDTGDTPEDHADIVDDFCEKLKHYLKTGEKK